MSTSADTTLGVSGSIVFLYCGNRHPKRQITRAKILKVREKSSTMMAMT
jgi:hypothetical protein